MDDYLRDFIGESERNVTELNDSLSELADDPRDRDAMDSIFRAAHTLKGNLRAMGFVAASDLAHAIEDLLDEIRRGRVDATPGIVDLVFAGVDEIDLALDRIESDGEANVDPDDTIAEIRAAIEGNAGDGDAPELEESGPSGDASDDAGIDDAEPPDADDGIAVDLQGAVADARSVPLKRVVDRFPRLVRELAHSQGKVVELVTEDEDIQLDRTIADEIGNPLLHLLRNAVDHGIEPPEEREAAGKPREGTIYLRGRCERDRVIVEVEDDGRGLDVDAIRETAVEQGIERRDAVEKMADPDVYDLILHPGFSTREAVTDVSGRGVGMDVVNETVSRLDGTVSIDSEAGEGTVVGLTLPADEPAGDR